MGERQKTPLGNMPDYRLSAREEDLMAIAHYGDEYFGVAQSDRYRDQFNSDFQTNREESTVRISPTIPITTPSLYLGLLL